jgi:endonuclease/exonuclease/phosphatase (EEP) superfamily protein YafD
MTAVGLGWVVLGWACAGVLAGLVLLRTTRIDGSRHTAAVLALLPWAVAPGLALGLVAAAAGQPVLAVALLVSAVALGLAVAPRAVASRVGRSGVRGGEPAGACVRVLSANVYLGRADPVALVGLVRAHRVDVLCLQELTGALAAALRAAGLAQELPHLLEQPRRGGEGGAIASRWPLSPRWLTYPTTLAQPVAVIGPIAGTELRIRVVSVHPIPPTWCTGPRLWRRDLVALPPPCPELPTVLAGDFNATLDHGALRRVLRAGYRDAAALTGRGLRPTWPADRRRLPAFTTLDHQLVDAAGTVESFSVLPLPGSDHHGTLTTLRFTRPIGGSPGRSAAARGEQPVDGGQRAPRGHRQ